MSHPFVLIAHGGEEGPDDPPALDHVTIGRHLVVIQWRGTDHKIEPGSGQSWRYTAYQPE